MYLDQFTCIQELSYITCIVVYFTAPQSEGNLMVLQLGQPEVPGAYSINGEFCQRHSSHLPDFSSRLMWVPL